jgi:hypothetical protein
MKLLPSCQKRQGSKIHEGNETARCTNTNLDLGDKYTVPMSNVRGTTGPSIHRWGGTESVP